MTTNPTDAQMKLARECAAEAFESIPDAATHTLRAAGAFRRGELDDDTNVQSALLAIQATEARAQGLVDAERERCAVIAETMGHPWRDTIRQTDIGPMETKIRSRVTQNEIAAAIRNSQHGGKRER